MDVPEGPIAWLLSPEPVSVFVPPGMPDQAVADRLLFDETGVLTDRELRWAIEGLGAELDRFLRALSPQNPEPTSLGDVTESARYTAELLEQWRSNLAAANVQDGTRLTPADRHATADEPGTDR